MSRTSSALSCDTRGMPGDKSTYILVRVLWRQCSEPEHSATRESMKILRKTHGQVLVHVLRHELNAMRVHPARTHPSVVSLGRCRCRACRAGRTTGHSGERDYVSALVAEYRRPGLAVVTHSVNERSEVQALWVWRALAGQHHVVRTASRPTWDDHQDRAL